MTSNNIILFLFLISFFHLAWFPRSLNGQLMKCGFDAIYQLGDSISDTGNFITENPSSVYARLPYGETFFHKATGRCSNGLLIIDYFAKSAGIPLLDAYLNRSATFTRGRGVNFAVAGSTALPPNVLSDKGIKSLSTKTSLSAQLDLIFTHFNSICLNEEDCLEKLKSALFIVGEVGFNDYTYALFQSKSTKEVKAMVPEIVQAIKSAVTTVIDYGARRVIVPGSFPMGCMPAYLTRFQTNNSSAYDQFRCLKAFNDLSILHNNQLMQAIEQLKRQYPNVIIVYADNYYAFQGLLRNAARLGFDPKSTLKACCGIGGEYNYNLTNNCGAQGVPVCPQPDSVISWDGLCMTQKAYDQMSILLIHDIFPKLQCGV